MAADLKLKPHPTISKPKGPVLVCILDGWGENRYIACGRMLRV